MSQVKKLQSGGTPKFELMGAPEVKFEPLPELNFQKTQAPQQTQNIGTLTIDGKTYDATPEFIQSLSRYLSAYGEKAAPLSGLTAALQRGEHITYDSLGNHITGMSGKWTGVDDNADRKRGAGASQWRRNWDATFNNDAHKFRKAVSLLSGFGAFAPSSTSGSGSSSNLSNQLDIYGDRLWFDYANNDDGTRTYLKNSSKNLGIGQRLDRITNYLMSDDEGKKGYRLNEWYNPQRIDALKRLYETNASGWNQAISEIRRKAEAGEDLTADELAFLENFNIGPDSEPVASGKLSAADAKKWRDAGFGDDIINALNGKAHLNSDGSISLNEGESWGWNLGDIDGKNIYFNDDFYNSKYATSGDFNPYRGLTLYNGRLYGLNNGQLARILNSDDGYNYRLSRGDWAGANDLLLTRFTRAARENPVKLDDDKYSGFLSDKNYMYSNLTGILKANDSKLNGNGNQIISYIDLDEDSKDGPYRKYTYKYAVLDKRGNLVRSDLSLNDFSEIGGGKSKGALNTYSRVVNSGKEAHDGRYYEDIVTSSGKDTGYRIYTDPNNPKDVILHMPSIRANGVNANEEDIHLPLDVANILFKDPKIWDRIEASSQNAADFRTLISSLVRSNTRNSFAEPGYRRFGWRNFAPFDPIIRLFEGNGQLLRNLGFKGQDLKDLRRAFNDAIYRSGNRDERRQKYLVTAPILQKGEGGEIIRIEPYKLQYGGVAGGTKEAVGVSDTEINTKKPKNPDNAAIIGHGDEWTTADTADLTALVADIASLGAAFVPGANVASAVTGAAGSTARLKADLDRGTKGAGWNYLINLGMDAATLLPIAGGVSKGTKIVRSVKKALPLVIKAASVYGLGSAVVNSARKIASGEGWTIRDVDTVVNALTAGVGLSRQGGFGKKTKKVKNTVTEDLSLKPKAGKEGSELKLTAEEMKSIDDADKLADALFNKAKAGNSGLTKEQFAETYDVDSLFETAKAWKPGWNPKSWFKKKEVKSIKQPKSTTSKSKERITEEKGSFAEWWRGLSDENIAYNRQLSESGLGTQGGRRRVLIQSAEYKAVPKEFKPQSVKVKNKTIDFTPDEVAAIQSGRTSSYDAVASKLGSSATEKEINAFVNQYRKQVARGARNWEYEVDYTRPESIERPGWGARRIGTENVTRFEKPAKFAPKDMPVKYQDVYRTYMMPGIALPQFINPFTDANYQENELRRPAYPTVNPFAEFIEKNYFPAMKNGGVIKAQNSTPLGLGVNYGLNTRKSSSELVKEFNQAYGTDLKAPNIPTTLETQNNNASTTNASTTANAPEDDTLPSIKRAKAWLEEWKAKDSTDNDGSQSDVPGGEQSNPNQSDYAGEAMRFDLNPALNWFRAGYAMRQSDKQLKNWENRPKYQMLYPLLNAPRFISSGTGDAYRALAKAARAYKPVTSDAVQNDALMRQRQQDAFNYEMQGALADFKEFSQYLAGLDDFNNKNILRNTDIANKNREFDWNYDIQNVQMRNSNLAEKSKFFNEAAGSTQAWYDRNRQLKNEILARDAYQDDYEKYSTLYNKLMAEHNEKFKDDLNSDAAKEDLKLINTQLSNFKGTLGSSQLYAKLAPAFRYGWLKNGGKVGKQSAVTYSRDPYPELLIQSSKNSSKYVEKMADSVIKLILQTKPIHVS